MSKGLDTTKKRERGMSMDKKNEQIMIDQNKTGSKKTKRIVVIVGALVAVIAIVAVVFFIVNLPENKLNRALEKGDLKKAVEVYIESDSEELSDIFKEHIIKRVNEYACGDIDFETVNDILTEVENILDITEMVNNINAIKESKINYDKAVELVSYDDDINALSYFSKVSKEDVQNYDESIGKIEEILQSQLAQVKQYLEEKKFDSAYELICKIEKYEQIAEEAENVKKEIVTKNSEKLAEEAKVLYDKGEFVKTYKFIANIDRKYLNDNLNELKNKAKTEYVNNQLTSAKKLYDVKSYDEAIDILNKANTEIADVRFTNKISEYKKVRNSAVISSYKSKVTYKYDSIGKQYQIVPKGLTPGYLGIGYNRNIQPILVVSDSITIFYLYWGFANDSWIFMKQILIDCDGTQYTVKVDYFDRITEVSRGDIMEAYSVVDSKLAHDRWMNLEPIVKSMVNANKVTIRFRGDDYYIDKVIPKSHINEINTLWQIYKVLKDNPELISEL